MDQDDYLFLRDKAAECRERAGRARDEKDRALWLELAEEIAGRLPREPGGRLDTVVAQPGESDFGNA